MKLTQSFVFSGFNSMKVRLKRVSFGLLADLNLLFQFHEGPIKT